MIYEASLFYWFPLTYEDVEDSEDSEDINPVDEDSMLEMIS